MEYDIFDGIGMRCLVIALAELQLLYSYAMQI